MGNLLKEVVNAEKLEDWVQVSTGKQLVFVTLISIFAPLGAWICFLGYYSHGHGAIGSFLAEYQYELWFRIVWIIAYVIIAREILWLLLIPIGKKAKASEHYEIGQIREIAFRFEEAIVEYKEAAKLAPRNKKYTEAICRAAKEIEAQSQ